MSIRIFQVDAFASEAFSGNPAAVCMLTAPREEGWMHALAGEMNLSETAFLEPASDGWSLRWFTPTTEVELCGHGTLACAHVLWEAGYQPPATEIRFHTAVGLLTARQVGQWIEMDFPSQPTTGPVESADGLADVLGGEIAAAHHAGWTTLVELADASALRDLSPDFAAMKGGLWGSAIVTAASDSPEFDFVSRFFAPAIGIDEDPVTGSSHCVLGPFWSERLGKVDMVAYQASARGGVVKVTVAGERTKLSGQAVTVFRGELA